MDLIEGPCQNNTWPLPTDPQQQKQDPDCYMLEHSQAAIQVT